MVGKPWLPPFGGNTVHDTNYIFEYMPKILSKIEICYMYLIEMLILTLNLTFLEMFSENIVKEILNKYYRL